MVVGATVCSTEEGSDPKRRRRDPP